MTAAHNIDFVQMKQEIANDNASLQKDQSNENLARIQKNTSERSVVFRTGFTKDMLSDLDRVAAYKDNQALEKSLRSYSISDYMPGSTLDPETFANYNAVLTAIKKLKNDNKEEAKILEMITDLRFTKGKSIAEEHEVIKHLRSAYKNKITKNYIEYFQSTLNRNANRDAVLEAKLKKNKKDVTPVLQEEIEKLGF
jgi:hypothetical protein